MMDEEDPLAEYRSKRDFSKTPEPEGGTVRSSDKPIFVIQKHDASNLHYDFRLEVEGVLKSWAVPKGPSTDPSTKRLAIPTEDHALEYADFEGNIPEGEYGAGTVMVWDHGTYRNLRAEKEDAEARMTMTQSLEDGKVEIWLEGKKLEGGYVLIRTGSGKGARWLLIKMRDKRAQPERSVVEEEPKSAITGRTLQEIRESTID
ncbi:MAG: DNA ligase [Candidatus Thorarchaeota archaeon]|nr:DNA ligase [Candidatus Thorarchaeota archaeon]